MYEPKRPPQINRSTVALSKMRFFVAQVKEYIDLGDPTIDPLHIHDTLEFYLNGERKVKFLVNGKVYSVESGEMIISRRNDVHVCIFPESNTYDYHCLWIDADFSSPVFSFLRESRFSPHVTFDERKKERLRAILSELYQIQGDENKEVRKLALILDFLSEITFSDNKNEQTSNIPQQLLKVVSYVDENFKSLKGVRDIVETNFVSASTLNRQFRTYLQTTPRAYLEARKLSYALKLLKGGCSVTESCIESGFPDCSHFIVLFKKKFGATPLQYKKTNL